MRGSNPPSDGFAKSEIVRSSSWSAMVVSPVPKMLSVSTSPSMNLARSCTIDAQSCKVLQCFTFCLGRLSKLPFSAKSRKLTRGVRDSRAKSCTVVHKSSWPALPPFGPALPCLGPALASLQGRARLMHRRAWASTTMHGLELPGCTVMQYCARSCIGQHYHSWPSTTWLHGRAWAGTASARFGMLVHI
ncbi:hypothetical protein E3N88_34664 [Mikania micrantha]|uniref:Uncharacterized protein n=1 Tax=Mikania micrantha TaxID=192012 RepID=A0A5N6LYT4_9ASTR|nr:hypothetical protein E3N88_34664 [Mikania micrantha]